MSGGAARGPLRAVLDAVRAGAGDLAAVAERTGLDRDVVAAAVEHLLRTGHLRSERLTAGCPPSGCLTCGSHAAAGHGPAGPLAGVTGGCRGTTTPDDTGRGPVLITLTHPTS